MLNEEKNKTGLISKIGLFLRKNPDAHAAITGVLMCLIGGGYVLFFIIAIVAEWSDGFWTVLVIGIILVIIGAIGVIASAAVLLVATYLLNCIQIMLGAAFYNIYTLLIFAIMSTGVIYGNYNGWFRICDNESEVNANSEHQDTTTYVCTASEFINVRVSPNSKSTSVGRINRGEYVHVYEIDGGFAKIKFNDEIRYVNANYISKHISK